MEWLIVGGVLLGMTLLVGACAYGVSLYARLRDMEAHANKLSQKLETTKDALEWAQRVVNELTTTNDEAREQLKGLKAYYNDQFEAWKTQAEKSIRKDANSRSRATIRGQVIEHLAPLAETHWNHKDFRFLGSPIDYLICVGASDIIDGTSNHIKEVVLLDIKAANSQLNKVQRRIRDAVVAGRVKFGTYNTPRS